MKFKTIIIALILSSLYSCEDPDKVLWDNYNRAGTVNSYNQYLKECSECKYSESAKLKLEVLEKDNRNSLLSQEKQTWEKAKGSLDIDLIENYRSKCEICDYTTEANNYINDLNHWGRAKSKNTLEGYNSYLQNTILNLKNNEANRMIKIFEGELLAQERREKEKIRQQEEIKKQELLAKKQADIVRENRYKVEASNLKKDIRSQIDNILHCNANAGGGSVITGVDPPTIFKRYGSELQFMGTYSAKNILSYTGDYDGVYNLDQKKYLSVNFKLHSGFKSGPVKFNCLNDL